MKLQAVSPVASFVLDKIFGINERIDDALSLTRATSESGESRAHYWMRKAVTLGYGIFC
jgi:hypothetical protein